MTERRRKLPFPSTRNRGRQNDSMRRTAREEGRTQRERKKTRNTSAFFLTSMPSSTQLACGGHSHCYLGVNSSSLSPSRQDTTLPRQASPLALSRVHAACREGLATGPWRKSPGQESSMKKSNGRKPKRRRTWELSLSSGFPWRGPLVACQRRKRREDDGAEHGRGRQGGRTKGDRKKEERERTRERRSFPSADVSSLVPP